jgi:hypothetical protein
VGAGDPATKIIFKLRDKITFKVGRGMTFSKMRLEGLDSVSYYDYSKPDFWTTLVSDA